MTKRSAPGYSGTPLAGKLGVKEGCSVAVIGAPDDYEVLLKPLPSGLKFQKRASASTDIVHLFVTERSLLARCVPSLKPGLGSSSSCAKSSARRRNRRVEGKVGQA